MEELLHDGSISSSEYDSLIYKIDSRIKFIGISVSLSSLSKIDELLLICPIFKTLTES